MKMKTRIISVILTICIAVSMITASAVTASAAGLGIDSLKDWGAWELYSRGLNTAGSIIEMLGESTGNGDIAEATTFINNTFFGGSDTDEQIAELQNTCNKILDTVTNMEDVLNDVNSSIKEEKIKNSFDKYTEAWQKQVMNVLQSGESKEKIIGVYDDYCDYLGYASGSKTLPSGKTVEDYENIYISKLEKYYANMTNDYYNDSKILKQDEYYKYKMYTSSAVDMGISDVISSMLMNMDPDKNNLSSTGNKGHRFIDLAAQYAYYAYPFSVEQAEFIDVSVEAQINVITTLVMIYQDFLARRAEYYTEINKAVNFIENDISIDMLSEEDKIVYDEINRIVDECDTETEKKLLNDVKNDYSTIDDCNEMFSQYYGDTNYTYTYVGLMSEYQVTIEKFFNSEIYLSDVKASTTFDKYFRAEDANVSNLVNKNFKQTVECKEEQLNVTFTKKFNADFTKNTQSFYKSASVKVKDGKLVFTPFYVLDVGALASKYQKLKTFDVIEKFFTTNGCVDETHYLNGDYYNLVNGEFTDGQNLFVPVSDPSQLKDIINETYYTANGCTPNSYLSSMMEYSSGKDNYLLLKGKTDKKSVFLGATYTTIPVFNMRSKSGYSTSWQSKQMGYDDFSNSTYSLILVPKDGEIRSKVDTKIDGEGTVTVSGSSNATVVPGEKVKVNVNVGENYMISNISVQYHSDAGNPTKVTKEKVIGTDINTDEFTFDYIVPYSNVTISVETKRNYVVSSCDDLYKMADMVNSGNSEYTNGNYVLVNDIFFTDEMDWTQPIGTEENPFRGTFDGQGHKIENLYLDPNSTSSKMGLFGVIDGGTVENLNVGMCTYEVSKKHYSVGSICGYIKNGKISNCNVTGELFVYGDYCGGLVGVSEGSTIENCTSELYIIAQIQKAFGDICGFDDTKSVIAECTQNNIVTKC